MSKTLSAKFCQKNKKRLQKKLIKDTKILPKKKKEKKQQYGRERYKSLSKNEKQKLVEYRKKYHRMRKNSLL